MVSKKSPKQRRVVVFGVFDLLHKGHLSFFSQAKKYGDVVAIVARDSAVLKIKKNKTRHGERLRLAAVRRVPEISRAFLGDKIQGSYTALKKIRPSVVCLGYDQRALEADLRARMKTGGLPSTKIVQLKAHHPKKFKTSIVAKRMKWRDT